MVLVASALAAKPAIAPRAKGFSANHTVENPASSAARAWAAHSRASSPPWTRSAMRGRSFMVARSDVRGARLPAGLGEVHVHGLPAAGLLDHHHGRPRDERRTVHVIAQALGRGSLPLARRPPVARDQCHLTPNEHLEVVRFPPPRVDALAIVLPQPRPVLPADIGVPV